MNDQSRTNQELLEEISVLKQRIKGLEQSESEKTASLGQLSAKIAHELKNPLGIILQGISYVQSSVKDGALIDACERIKNSAIRADMVIQNLLGVSQQTPPSFHEEDMNIFVPHNSSKKGDT
jgi:polar amino acid transport system substrate-binding protein